jgi:hypothetical protein
MFRGHTDNAPANVLGASTDNDAYSGTGQTTGEQRRTLTLNNGEVIWDFSGDAWEWTQSTTEGGQQPGTTGGYAWRDWNTLTNPGVTVVNPFPSYANPSAASWTSSQNIGQVYSSSAEQTLRGFRRGGGINSAGNAGVFALDLNVVPTFTSSGLSFRVVRR